MVSPVHMPVVRSPGFTQRSAGKSRDSSGFTLIESMLAAVILTVGLLALAGMQGMSLGRNMDANELSRVTNLASDMIERIQFNRKNAIQYNAIDTTASTPCPTTVAMMAQGDCNQWRNLLNSSGLSGVQGIVQATSIVTTPSLNQTQVTLTINWTGSVNGDGLVKRTRTITMRTVVAPE